MRTGLKGVTEYIQCLATRLSTATCALPPAMQHSLTSLIQQNVQPIVVWAKCKSNYLLQSWDAGAGALFSDGFLQGVTPQVYDHREAARKWAHDIDPAFLACMASPSRFQVDYDVCMRMYLNLTTGHLPNAYFLYAPSPPAATAEPPDACLVFSGLNRSAQEGSPLQSTMQSCMMDSSRGDPAHCPYNPSVWSSTSPAQVPVAKLFGTTQEDEQPPNYAELVQRMQAAFARFNSTFWDSAKQMQIELFSADGDFIHDFMDCVFLGPYTRTDLLPCDEAGTLDCPFYARDELGGMSREFTPCYGPVMHGDYDLPFTCGSPARRAIIKYFFRDYVLKNLGSQITALLYGRVRQLWANLTNTASYGCLDRATGQCSPQACSRANAYTPCLDLEFTVSASAVSQFLLKDILLHLDSYYALVLQVSLLSACIYRLLVI